MRSLDSIATPPPVQSFRSIHFPTQCAPVRGHDVTADEARHAYGGADAVLHRRDRPGHRVHPQNGLYPPGYQAGQSALGRQGELARRASVCGFVGCIGWRATLPSVDSVRDPRCFRLVRVCVLRLCGRLISHGRVWKESIY